MLMNTKGQDGNRVRKNILFHWERKWAVHLVAVYRCYLKHVLNRITVQFKTAKRKLLLFSFAAIGSILLQVDRPQLMALIFHFLPSLFSRVWLFSSC